MPKIIINYNNTIIYKIVCKDVNITDCYVGQTTHFTNRKSQHKTNCNNINNSSYNCYVYQFIREHNGWDNWDMIEIEKYNAIDRLDAGKKERYWVETLQATLNKNIPSRTEKEYRIDNNDKTKARYKQNKDKILQYHKEYYKQNKEKSPIYYELNKDKVQNYHKEYNEKNKDKLTEQHKDYYKQNKDQLNQKHSCVCGGKYTTQHKLIHEKTKKHIDFVKTI